jgi:hypothetical protein
MAIASWPILGMLLGSISGPFFWIPMALESTRTEGDSWLVAAIQVLILGPVLGAVAGLVVGLLCTLISLVIGRTAAHARGIQPAETLRWSWSSLRAGCRRSVIAGIVTWLVCGLAIGLPFGLATNAVIVYIFVGLMVGAALGLIAGLVSLILGGLVTSKLDTRTLPNQGMHRSARNALLVGLAGGAAVWVAFGAVLEKAISLFAREDYTFGWGSPLAGSSG